MGKLDPVRIEWIVKEAAKGQLTQSQIADQMGISTRYVRKLYAKYKATGKVPVFGSPARPKISTGSNLPTIL